MTIRFLKTPEASVPTASGPSLFVDTDGTPKLKQADGSIGQLLRVTSTKVVLATAEDPVANPNATALFGKDYGGVVELAIKQGNGSPRRMTQGAGLFGSVDEAFPGSTKSLDLTLPIPAGLINDLTYYPLGLTVAPLPSVQWCVFHCHLEIVLLNALYQTQPGGPGTDYTEMRGATVSADFALLFDNTMNPPNARYQSTPLIPLGIAIGLQGEPQYTPDVAPFGITVAGDGSLSLEVLRTVTSAEKYWAVLSVSISPPINIQVP